MRLKFRRYVVVLQTTGLLRVEPGAAFYLPQSDMAEAVSLFLSWNWFTRKTSSVLTSCYAIEPLVWPIFQNDFRIVNSITSHFSQAKGLNYTKLG